MLGRYLTSHMGRMTKLSTARDAPSAALTLEGYSNANFGGSPGMDRRSTDCAIVIVGESVVLASSQTQPGVPAKSSAESKVRGALRCSRELVFLEHLYEEDFGLAVVSPRLWLDSTAAIQSQEKLGPCSKLRGIEIGEFYCQELVRSKSLELCTITKN